jgi:hypothetical protein
MNEMTRTEMVQILEEIARDEKAQDGPRITALRTLKELRDEDEAKDPASGFDELDEVGKQRAKRPK